MPIGSAGFTIVALIGAARSVPTDYGYFATHPTAPEILLVVATWVGVFLWVFGLWLFGVALFITLGSVMVKEDGVTKFPMAFKNTWWGEYTSLVCRRGRNGHAEWSGYHPECL